MSNDMRFREFAADLAGFVRWVAIQDLLDPPQVTLADVCARAREIPTSFQSTAPAGESVPTPVSGASLGVVVSGEGVRASKVIEERQRQKEDHG